MYDVIVIGARCAGAPAAMLLGRKGYKVLLVDRATFPSDVPHGHFIHRHGPRRLARWGLLDRIAATGCPPVATSTMDLGDFPLVGTNLVADGVALGYGPRRSVFDMAMIDAASEAGVEIRTGYAVEGFTNGPRSDHGHPRPRAERRRCERGIRNHRRRRGRQALAAGAACRRREVQLRPAAHLLVLFVLERCGR